MSRRLLVGFALALLLILVAARRHRPATVDGQGLEVDGDPLAMRPITEVDDGALGIRVSPGEGADVPGGLAAEMQAWPEAPPADREEVELGRLLFFDPLLSRTNQVSCASCHHPDLGLADGLAHAVGVSGEPLPRSAPSLWNVGLRAHWTWDGGRDSLESQMLEGPLFHPDEMGESPESLLAKLRNNAEYARRFREVYGEVSLENLASAIAAFQRTLLTRDSPFDRYAGGDYYALTGAQRRGFEIFRSERTNCIACHELPTFSTPEFKVIGVRDDLGSPFDAGRGAITGAVEEEGAFAVPTLRNVALTAPYMHNGIEPTLTSAIAFYLNGGGDNLNVPRSRLDPDLRSFDLPTRSLEDLEAFLLSLTDESGLPDIPAELPSGLEPVQPRENPARSWVAAASALPPGAPRTHEVSAGESIQAAVDRSRPGDTVLVRPGRYFEPLDIDVERLTLRGEGATLVGRPFTPVGIVIRHNDVLIEGLTLEGFEQATIELRGARGAWLEEVTLNGYRVSGLLDDLAR